MAPKILLVHPSRCTPQLDSKLSGQGYEILRADNGLKFVSALEVENPDLIIMDSRPQFSDSHTLCSAIRSGRFQYKPVFFLSPDLNEEECRQSSHCGCTQVFQMPRQMPALMRRIRECAGTP
jgi:DNA-binding response OmpR family regulator